MNLKKSFSMATAALVVMSSGIFPSTVHAQGYDFATGTYLEENFDTITSSDTSELVDNYGWKYNSGGITSEIVGDADKVVQMITQNAELKYYFTPDAQGDLTTGLYEIKVSVNPKTTGGRFLVDFASGTADSDTAGDLNIIASFNSGKLHLQQRTSDIAAYQIADFSTDTWYDFVAIVDLDARYYSVEVWKGENKIAYRNGIVFDAKTTGLGKIRLRNWGQDQTVQYDKVSVKKYNGTMDKVFADDDFEKYTDLKDGDYATTVVNNVWKIDNSDKSTAELDKTTFADDTTHKQVIKLQRVASDEARLRYNFYDAPLTFNDRLLKIQASIYPGSSKSVLDLMPDSGDNLAAITFRGDDSKNMLTILSESDGSQQFTLKKYSPEKWYDVTLLVDMDRNMFHLKIMCEGELFAYAPSINLRRYNDARQDKGMLPNVWGFRYRNMSYDAATYIDNIKVELIERQDAQIDPVICNEDFENFTSANYQDGIWYSDGSNGSIDFEEVVGSGKGKSVKILGQSRTIVGRFSHIVTGKIKFSYDIYVNGSSMHAAIWTHSGATIALAFVDTDGKIYGKRVTTGNSPELLYTAPTTGVWLKMENIVDLDRRTILYIIKDAQGNQIMQQLVEGAAGEPPLFYDAGGPGTVADANTSFNRVRIRKLDNSATPVYVDNFSVELYSEKPALTTERVSVTTVTDAKITDLTQPISPAIKTINLDFGCGVTPASATAAISLTPAGGSPTQFTGNVTGTVFNMNLAKLLMPNTQYTLIVASTVQGADGSAMDTAFNMNFSTGEGFVEVNSIDLKKGDAIVDSLDDIAQDDTLSVNLSYINCSDINITPVVIVAYYDEFKLAQLQSVDLPIAQGGWKLDDKVNFTVKDLTDIDSIRVFVWDGFYGMIPHCGAKSIPEE